jgi:AcrR family transcriptional regulator
MQLNIQLGSSIPMRARTDEKRHEIVRIAAKLFEELGYDRASMSAIAAQVGGSKATLYGYFPSKEDLLRAVLDHDVNEEADRLMHEFLAEKDLRSGLVRLGISYLSRHHARAARIRTVANQPIAEEFYKNVLRPAWQRLADRFAAMMKEGRLRFADPWTTAMHWKGLNEWDMLERHLLSAAQAADPNDIVTAATAAADAFLKVYATPPQPGEIAL